MPRRMSVWPTASHTRTPEGIGIIALRIPGEVARESEIMSLTVPI